MRDIKSKDLISHHCQICGAIALCRNYGVLACDSCKIFFRRNATKEKDTFRCDFHGNCEININNRHICTFCRLMKCFSCGMQIDLLRCPRSNNKQLIEKDKLEQSPILNLLQSDTSTLDSNQWILLSNLVHNYDERTIISIAQQFIKQSNAFESLISTDLTLSKQFFIDIYETTRAYIRSNTDLYTLSSDDRSSFLRNIAENITCFGTVLSWNQSQIYNCKPFMNIYIDLYGQNSMNMIQRILKLIDSDIIIAKLALSLFAFSNHTSIFSRNMILQSLNTLAIFHIQNIYIEITWKYFLYKYGYFQSIQRFNKLIQCLLAATTTVSDSQNDQKHINEITLLVEETELSLILDDIERTE